MDKKAKIPPIVVVSLGILLFVAIYYIVAYARGG